MKKFILVVLLFVASLSFAESETVELERATIDLSNKESLQDGLNTFMNYCIGCHSAAFQRYERTAKDLDIPEDVMMKYVVLPSFKIGDHMLSTLRPADAKSFFGVVPPDLTMVTRVRGSDWVYSYLKAFYVDEARPFGANNKIFPNVGMPNVLERLQGEQTIGCKHVPMVIDGKVELDLLTGRPATVQDCNQLVVSSKGKLSEREFDEKVNNLVNYLSYMAEPQKLQSQRIGTYVLFYLLILMVVTYLLKKEYWKDVE